MTSEEVPKTDAEQIEKSILKSKTFWFGLAIVLLPFIEEIAKDPIVTKHPMAFSIVGAIVIALRVISASAVVTKIKRG